MKERKRKVHSLIDKVYSLTNLDLAWAKVKANRGGAGVDRMTIDAVTAHWPEYRLELHQALKDGVYRPQPVKRGYIPKPDGRQRPLGIPTVLDRVVQQALLNRLEPIFEQKFLPVSFGFRSGKSTHDAMRGIWRDLQAGWQWIVDGDIQDCFGSIPHERLIDLVAEEISDGRVLGLIRQFLTADIQEGMERRKATTGTPQGGGISPLLCNIFLHEFDRAMVAKGYKLTRYADDWAILCHSRAQASKALQDAKAVLEGNLGLVLHPTKTRIVHITQGFEFLGYRVRKGGGVARVDRGPSIYVMPRDKSVEAFRGKVRELTRRRSHKTLVQVIAELNPLLRGWGMYYRKAHVMKLFHRLDEWVRRRIWAFIAKRWRSTAYRRYPSRRLHGEMGLVNLFALIPRTPKRPLAGNG